ncbi:unnamed protein product [Acanthoscelides obtectus]|uniref:Uncharacterized protein n=1 Tax=Acanthoscelides obtectus TaxID=200917 RepID=A0A9P0PQ01_ACAOB|nr:unnamed protein product [Acanthoscelides obtectus]CAK1634056.1 hypothetical protein AOBTE_LOCUS8568 [Acanthoscelides obtectus]
MVLSFSSATADIISSFDFMVFLFSPSGWVHSSSRTLGDHYFDLQSLSPCF